MKINPEGQPTGSTPNQGPISPEPIDVLQANIEKLLANQRTPGTIEIRRSAWWALLVGWAIEVALSVVLITFGIHGLVHDDSAPAVHAPAVHAVANVTGTSDAQLAADLTAACDAHPGACRHTPTAADVESEFVPYVCAWIAQPTAPAGTGTPAWRAAWPQIASIVAATGRCTNPPDGQLAAELAWLPGASGTPVSAADLAEVVKRACPEIGAPVPHTAYAAGVLRVIAASGRCGR